MKIHLLSDLHLEFAAYEPDKAAVEECDVVVLAGDIDRGSRGLMRARYLFPSKRIIYIAGNHEFYRENWSELLDELHEEADAFGIHFLENNFVDVQGVRFLGCTLWTDFKFHRTRGSTGVIRACEKHVSDFQDIRADPLRTGHGSGKRLSARHVIERHEQSMSWLQTQLAVCNEQGLRPVAVTHHLPTARSVAPRDLRDDLTATVASHLDDLIPQAHLWMHGHVHDSYDYLVDAGGRSTRVVCNPRGYPTSDERRFQNPAFNPGLIVEI